MTSRIVCSACGASNGEFAGRCASCDACLSTASLRSPAGARGAEGSLEGREVGHYHVQELLGSGATGAVYKATDSRLLRPVALKVLSEKLSPNDRARGRMLREARAAARLKSRHVVHILDHGIWSDRPYIAMEYLEGQTLRARLVEATRLSPAETARWISQIAAGLEKAHAAGIIHRDLKPENVLLAHDEEGVTAKILDFGVAKAGQHLADVAATHAGTLIGTPAYMSPEQANGATTLDHRSDLWSLGVIAFECLTGRRPFDRKELGALCVQILSEPLPVPSAVVEGIPPAFDAWWARAAARDPESRFQSAGDLASALSEALSSGTESKGWTLSEPVDPSVAPPPAHRLSSKFLRPALALAAVVTLVALTLASLRSGGRPPLAAVASSAPSAAPAPSEDPAEPAPPTAALREGAPPPPPMAPSVSTVSTVAPTSTALVAPPSTAPLRPAEPSTRALAPSAKLPVSSAPPSSAPPSTSVPSPAEPPRESHPVVEPEPGMWNQRD